MKWNFESSFDDTLWMKTAGGKCLVYLDYSRKHMIQAWLLERTQEFLFCCFTLFLAWYIFKAWEQHFNLQIMVFLPLIREPMAVNYMFLLLSFLYKNIVTHFSLGQLGLWYIWLGNYLRHVEKLLAWWHLYKCRSFILQSRFLIWSSIRNWQIFIDKD